MCIYIYIPLRVTIELILVTTKGSLSSLSRLSSKGEIWTKYIYETQLYCRYFILILLLIHSQAISAFFSVSATASCKLVLFIRLNKIRYGDCFVSNLFQNVDYLRLFFFLQLKTYTFCKVPNTLLIKPLLCVFACCKTKKSFSFNFVQKGPLISTCVGKVNSSKATTEEVILS